MIRDFLEPVEEYLGVPYRNENLVDELLSSQVFKIDQSVIDPSGTYRQIETIVVDPATAVATGDNKVTITVPFDAVLVSAHAYVTTVSSSGKIQISLQDKNNKEILAGILEIDANENGSENAINQPIVDPRYQLFNRYDIIKVNIDSAGTSSAGLVVQLYFVVSKFYYN